MGALPCQAAFPLDFNKELRSSPPTAVSLHPVVQKRHDGPEVELQNYHIHPKLLKLPYCAQQREGTSLKSKHIVSFHIVH